MTLSTARPLNVWPFRVQSQYVSVCLSSCLCSMSFYDGFSKTKTMLVSFLAFALAKLHHASQQWKDCCSDLWSWAPLRSSPWPSSSPCLTSICPHLPQVLMIHDLLKRSNGSFCPWFSTGSSSSQGHCQLNDQIHQVGGASKRLSSFFLLSACSACSACSGAKWCKRTMWICEDMWRRSGLQLLKPCSSACCSQTHASYIEHPQGLDPWWQSWTKKSMDVYGNLQDERWTSEQQGASRLVTKEYLSTATVGCIRTIGFHFFCSLHFSGAQQRYTVCA